MSPAPNSMTRTPDEIATKELIATGQDYAYMALLLGQLVPDQSTKNALRIFSRTLKQLATALEAAESAHAVTQRERDDLLAEVEVLREDRPWQPPMSTTDVTVLRQAASCGGGMVICINHDGYSGSTSGCPTCSPSSPASLSSAQGDKEERKQEALSRVEGQCAGEQQDPRVHPNEAGS